MVDGYDVCLSPHPHCVCCRLTMSLYNMLTFGTSWWLRNQWQLERELLWRETIEKPADKTSSGASTYSTEKKPRFFNRCSLNCEKMEAGKKHEHRILEQPLLRTDKERQRERKRDKKAIASVMLGMYLWAGRGHHCFLIWACGGGWRDGGGGG